MKKFCMSIMTRASLRGVDGNGGGGGGEGNAGGDGRGGRWWVGA